jgi:antitoxin VapB
MPLNIRSEEVNELATLLAERSRSTKTEAVRLALRHELQSLDKPASLRKRVRPIRDRIMARSATGLEADKAFYDELSGDLRCSSTRRRSG